MKGYYKVDPKDSALKFFKGFKTDGVKPYLTELNHFKLEDFGKVFTAFAQDNLDKTNRQILDGFLNHFGDIFYDPGDSKFYLDQETGKVCTKYKTNFSFYSEFVKQDHDFKRKKEVEIDLLRAENVDFSWVKDKLKYEHRMRDDFKRFYFVQAFRQLFPNTSIPHLGKSLTSVRRFIQNFWHKIDPSLCKEEQTCLYLYSPEGGTGKSFVLKSLIDFAESLELPVSRDCDLRTRWFSESFATALVSTVDELFPPKSNESTVITQLNNILDGENFTAEKKFVDPKTLKSRTVLAVTSNHFPFQENDRRYAVVRFNGYSINAIHTDPVASASLPKLDKEARNNLWKILFTCCPFDTVFANFVDGIADENMIKRIHRIRDLNQLPTSKDFVSKCTETTPKQFCDLMYEAEIAASHPVQKNNLRADLTSLIFYLINNKFIKPIERRSAGAYYSVYNFVDIMNLPLIEDDEILAKVIPAKLMEEDDFLKRNDMVLDHYIKTFYLPEGDDAYIEDTPQVVVVEDSPSKQELKVSKDIAVSDDLVNEGLNRFGLLEKDELTSQSPTYERSNQHSFIQISPYEPSLLFQHKTLLSIGKTPKIDATSEKKVPAFLIYEADKISLEEQAKIIEECCEAYTDNLFSVTWSGNKSFHVLFPLIAVNQEDVDYIKTHFSEIWKTVGTKIFGDYLQHFDTNCAVWSKLSRRQNGTRVNDDGTEVKQTCCWMNPDCVSLDVAEIIAATKARLEAKNCQPKKALAEKQGNAEVEKVKECVEAKEDKEAAKPSKQPAPKAVALEEDWEELEDMNGVTFWENVKTGERRTDPPSKNDLNDEIKIENSTSKSTETEPAKEVALAFDPFSEIGMEAITKDEIDAVVSKLSKDEAAFCLQMLRERDRSLVSPKKDIAKRQKDANYYNFAAGIILYQNPLSGSPMFGLINFLNRYGTSANHAKSRGCIEKVQDICIELHPTNIRKPIVFNWQKIV